MVLNKIVRIFFNSGCKDTFSALIMQENSIIFYTDLTQLIENELLDGQSFLIDVISYVAIIEKRVILLTIYDKSEKENISDEELFNLIKAVF